MPHICLHSSTKIYTYPREHVCIYFHVHTPTCAHTPLIQVYGKLCLDCGSNKSLICPTATCRCGRCLWPEETLRKGVWGTGGIQGVLGYLGVEASRTWPGSNCICYKHTFRFKHATLAAHSQMESRHRLLGSCTHTLSHSYMCTDTWPL